MNIKKSFCTTSKHLVRITLVTDIKNDFIFGSIKNIMQSHSSLSEAQIRSNMPTMITYTIKNS